MVALTAGYQIGSEPTDSRAINIQITPQIIATRKAIQRIQQSAAFLSAEYIVDPEKYAVIHAKVLIGRKPNSPVTIDNIPEDMREECLGCKLGIAKDREMMVLGIRELERKKGNEDPLPSSEALKKEHDSLNTKEKKVYETIISGVANSFYIPGSNPKISAAMMKLNLSVTLNKIADVENIKDLNVKSLFKSRIIVKQVLNTVREYSSCEAFQKPEQNKWTVNRLITLASIPSN